MRWHWLYRDFLTAFHDHNSERDWMSAFTHRYLDRHRHELLALHFIPKGFPTVDSALERVRILGRSRYVQMVNAIEGNPGFEDGLRGQVTRLMEVLGSPEPDLHIYVIVGLACTNIYSLRGPARPVTVLCLEAVDGNPAGLRLLLSHEAHHWARQAVHGPGILSASVGERLASEGLAIAFSQRLNPGLPGWEYCFVPERTYRWVEANLHAMRQLMEPDADGTKLMDALFARTPGALPLPGMPERTGYVYGFLAAAKALGDNLSNHGVSLKWKDLITMYWC